MAVPAILRSRRVVVPALILYLIGAAFIGGPWFALFTGGLLTAAAGFYWWTSREKKLHLLGTSTLVAGLLLTGSGIALGNNPTILPDEELPYQPVVPRPTAPVFVPAARPPASANAVAQPDDAHTHGERLGARVGRGRPHTGTVCRHP